MSPSLDGQVSWLAERGMKTAGNISSAPSPVSVVVEVALFRIGQSRNKPQVQAIANPKRLQTAPALYIHCVYFAEKRHDR